MKRLISICIFVLILIPNAFSQNWLTSFEKAKKEASNSGKSIILVFSGSDWCVPCIKLEKEIWESETFIQYADSNYVMLRADFPKRKKNQLPKKQQEHNEMLAEKYNNKGAFPLVVVLDAKGNVLGKTGYKNIDPGSYIELLNSFK
ncbi:MAG: thioredoxin family protein [Bacteroidales bacterium]|nr:thioredoxin family protein [Bacteroidales bacterium]MCF8328684.1 thioredoxin family protein [Bacteroidales bacterium]